ncbi:PfkB family carbohydrate kinase [Streptomyces xiaopingdaonensis]|uniref:PfkB family carbohydrate kinase n=1 Tax=Streptomyces xiaopingdaonensis TaxID=1565415 RepID=UPI000314FA1F|nr:PfkB family carbohydrate kinase [Streptomyces xiaopingdaonensis]
MRIAVFGPLGPDPARHLHDPGTGPRAEALRGGAGANVAYGLGVLGLAPVLVAEDPDPGGVRARLERHGVKARPESVPPYEGTDLVVLASRDPEAMLRHTAECREAGIPFATRPPQRLDGMSRADAQFLITGAGHLFTNERQASVLQERSGWSARRVLDSVGTWITSLGPDGVLLERDGHEPVVIPAVPGVAVADGVGAGDALCAGTLAGTARGLAPADACRFGCVVASLALEAGAAQGYGGAAAGARARTRTVYGDGADTVGARTMAGAV